MKMSRKRFLRLGLAGGVALALPFGASACSSRGDDSTGNLLPSEATLPEPFRVPLPVPPVLEPTRSDADADYYEIAQRVAYARSEERRVGKGSRSRWSP